MTITFYNKISSVCLKVVPQQHYSGLTSFDSVQQTADSLVRFTVVDKICMYMCVYTEYVTCTKVQILKNKIN